MHQNYHICNFEPHKSVHMHIIVYEYNICNKLKYVTFASLIIKKKKHTDTYLWIDFTQITILFLNISKSVGVFCARRLNAGSPTRGTRTHTNAASLYTCSSRCTYTCVCLSHPPPLFPCPSSPRLALSLSLSWSFSLYPRVPLPLAISVSLSLSFYLLALSSSLRTRSPFFVVRFGPEDRR